MAVRGQIGAVMARWGWGTAGKMVGVGLWGGIPDRGWDNVPDTDGVPDRDGVPVMWWDTGHRWCTRQGWWDTRYGWWDTRYGWWGTRCR